MSDDGDIRGRVGDAGEDESRGHLVVVKEAAVRLVDGAGLHLPCAGRARSRAAGVGQVESRHFGCVQDVSVVIALEGGVARRCLQGDIVGRHAGEAPHAAALEPERLGDGHR